LVEDAAMGAIRAELFPKRFSCGVFNLQYFLGTDRYSKK
jgi:hypothetical protein